MEMGNGGKLHLKFKTKFWPDKAGLFAFKGFANHAWVSSGARSTKGQNVICFLICGDSASMINEKGIDFMINNILEVLTEAFN